MFNQYSYRKFKTRVLVFFQTLTCAWEQQEWMKQKKTSRKTWKEKWAKNKASQGLAIAQPMVTLLSLG